MSCSPQGPVTMVTRDRRYQVISNKRPSNNYKPIDDDDPLYDFKDNHDDEGNHGNINDVTRKPPTTTTTPFMTTTTITTTTTATTTATTTTTTTLPTTTTTEATPPVDDIEIYSIVQRMWDAAKTGFLYNDIDYMLQLQAHIDDVTLEDLSPKRLFHQMKVDLRRHSAIHKLFLRLLNNYDAPTGGEEELTPEEESEQQRFLDGVLETEAMSLLEEFLMEKDLLSRPLVELLTELWFTSYHRSDDVTGPILSSGFECVFAGEKRGAQTQGVTNWLQFYREERSRNINYHGYIQHVDNLFLTLRYTWHETTLITSTLLMGTTPDFELALYTLCAMVRPTTECSFTLDGGHVTVAARKVVGDGGRKHIWSAKPVM